MVAFKMSKHTTKKEREEEEDDEKKNERIRTTQFGTDWGKIMPHIWD